MATTKGKRSEAPKGLTDYQQEKEFKRIKAEIEKLRRRVKKEENFDTLTDDQLREKLRRTNTGLQWPNSVAAGGSFNFFVFVDNPGPIDYDSLYVHTFIGPANVVSDVGVALQIVDARFPRLTVPTGLGLSSLVRH
jgi:hypothetical protein